jgi:hypothetical protein
MSQGTASFTVVCNKLCDNYIVSNSMLAVVVVTHVCCKTVVVIHVCCKTTSAVRHVHTFEAQHSHVTCMRCLVHTHSEKVLIAQERMSNNHVYCFKKKQPSKYQWVCETRSHIERGEYHSTTTRDYCYCCYTCSSYTAAIH